MRIRNKVDNKLRYGSLRNVQNSLFDVCLQKRNHKQLFSRSSESVIDFCTYSKNTLGCHRAS